MAFGEGKGWVFGVKAGIYPLIIRRGILCLDSRIEYILMEYEGTLKGTQIRHADSRNTSDQLVNYEKLSLYVNQNGNPYLVYLKGNSLKRRKKCSRRTIGFKLLVPTMDRSLQSNCGLR